MNIIVKCACRVDGFIVLIDFILSIRGVGRNCQRGCSYFSSLPFPSLLSFFIPSLPFPAIPTPSLPFLLSLSLSYLFPPPFPPVLPLPLPSPSLRSRAP